MSYCVNCGVELDGSAAFCPLCHTPVVNPAKPADAEAPTPFPTQRTEVPRTSGRAAAVLVTAMALSVAVCCGVLNLYFHGERLWSLYVIGAAAMLWVWVVPALLAGGKLLLLRLALDDLAVALYVFLISVDLDGGDWYWSLALPIILLAGAALLFLGLLLQGGRRSILSSVTLVIGTAGVFLFGVEFFIDRFLLGRWQPGWSLIVLMVCVGLVIPLIVVRRVPALREEARRRFHL